MAIRLDEVVPWGRTKLEYELMFNLTQEDSRKTILGCADGPASFNAEMTAAGNSVVSIDPIFEFSAVEIRARFDAVMPKLLSQVEKSLDKWNWSFHKNVQGLKENRSRAMELFVADFEHGKRAGRYRVGAVPNLPFPDACFKLALCSHFLFLYSDLLNVDFHCNSVLELCRVADEVRIFPILTHAQVVSPHLEAVRTYMQSKGVKSAIEKVNYEFQKGGNEMLRFWRAP